MGQRYTLSALERFGERTESWYNIGGRSGIQLPGVPSVALNSSLHVCSPRAATCSTQSWDHTWGPGWRQVVKQYFRSLEPSIFFFFFPSPSSSFFLKGAPGKMPEMCVKRLYSGEARKIIWGCLGLNYVPYHKTKC